MTDSNDPANIPLPFENRDRPFQTFSPDEYGHSEIKLPSGETAQKQVAGGGEDIVAYRIPTRSYWDNPLSAKITIDNTPGTQRLTFYGSEERSLSSIESPAYSYTNENGIAQYYIEGAPPQIHHP